MVEGEEGREHERVARHQRPPRKGRFQPGQSGNPRGRPKGSKNIRTYVHKLLSAKIPVIEGGKTRNIARAEAIAIQLVNLASKGDPKGLVAVMNLTREFDEANSEPRLSALTRIEDEEVMKGLIARIRAGDAPLSPDAAAGSPSEGLAHSSEPDESPSDQQVSE